MRNRETDVLKVIEKTGAAPWPFFHFLSYDPRDDVEQEAGAASRGVSSKALWTD